jgi:Ran GTPase-activating protein (RanGAP) involved in mRNA processing and transport
MSTVKNWYLSNNDLPDAGITVLIEMLKYNKTLKILNLDKNQITNRIVKMLCPVLKQKKLNIDTDIKGIK